MLLRLGLLMCALGITANATAGEGGGRITKLMPGLNAGAVIFTTETHTNKPACSTQANDWALSVNTEGGRAMYALLLSAASTGKTINVVGKNDCSVWADREAPYWIYIQP